SRECSAESKRRRRGHWPIGCTRFASARSGRTKRSRTTASLYPGRPSSRRLLPCPRRACRDAWGCSRRGTTLWAGGRGGRRAGTPNFEKVTQGLKVLQDCLSPFVYRELSAKLGGRWWTDGVLPPVGEQTRRELPGSGNEKALVNRLDVAALLVVIQRNWDQVFRDKLSRDDRTYVNELISTR